MFNALCILRSSPSAQPNKQVTPDHHLYNQLTHMGQTSIKVAIFINVAAIRINVATTLSLTDYAALGFSTSLFPRSTTLLVMADTGCQSCLAGISAFNGLCITAEDLIHVTMQMHTVNNEGHKHPWRCHTMTFRPLTLRPTSGNTPAHLHD